MAYTTINKQSAHFNTKLYTGNASTNAITGVGFQPDLVWLKRRDGSGNHNVYDSARGVTKYLESSSTAPEQTQTYGLTAFGTDGFTLGSNGNMNGSSQSFVSWNWKAGGTGSSNTDGSITSTVSANTTAGFSIVKWTGTGANATIGHGLGVAPSVVMTKNLDTNGTNWIYGGDNIGWTKYMVPNLTNNEATASNAWNDTAPTSTVVSLGSSSVTNASANMIAYCFAEKTGFSKFGKFTSKGDDDGVFVNTGFAPQLVMLKPLVTDGWSNWYVFDNVRRDYNLNDKPLYWNLSTQEAYYGGSPASNYAQIDILSNGFKIRRDGNWGPGASNQASVYMAFGQTLVGTNNVPVTAR